MVQPAGVLAAFNNAVSVITSDLGNKLVEDPLHRLLISTIMCFCSNIGTLRSIQSYDNRDT